ncbi:hypothetical protein AKJ16_DCAP21819 [Drosera capensis]
MESRRRPGVDKRRARVSGEVEGRLGKVGERNKGRQVGLPSCAGLRRRARGRIRPWPTEFRSPFAVSGVGKGVAEIRPYRFLRMLGQLMRDLYSAYQRKRVEEVDDDRLKFEINTMLWREGIEMSMSSSSDKMEEVKFAVPLLDMDINKLVPVYPWRQQQKIFLQVIYPIRKKYSSGSSAPRLKLVSTPEMRSFFPVEDIKLASWFDRMCMAEYLPALEENLQMQVLEAVTLIGARKRFIEALAPVFGRPLEADPVFCRKATVFVTNGMFMFLVCVVNLMPYHLLFPRWITLASNVSGAFSSPPSISEAKPVSDPTECDECRAPLIQQHFNQQGMPVRSASLTDFPWSPRWDSSQMAERLS